MQSHILVQLELLEIFLIYFFAFVKYSSVLESDTSVQTINWVFYNRFGVLHSIKNN